MICTHTSFLQISRNEATRRGNILSGGCNFQHKLVWEPHVVLAEWVMYRNCLDHEEKSFETSLPNLVACEFSWQIKLLALTQAQIDSTVNPPCWQQPFQFGCHCILNKHHLKLSWADSTQLHYIALGHKIFHPVTLTKL